MLSPAPTLRTLLFAGLFFVLQNGVTQAQQNPTSLSVAVSIRPLHSLISSLMAGTGYSPSLIITGGASPHGYSLKPSDARKLSAARLVFWIGPGMESFLVRPLASLADKADVVNFVPRGDANPHIWLSPIKARAMAKTALARLIKVDPGHADLYRRNGAILDQRLSDLQSETADLLNAVKSRPFLVYHDAYEHLAEAFDLNIAGMVTVNPERPPGARRIGELRKLMATGQVSCLFVEPGVGAGRLNMIVENVEGARIGILDPLGFDLPTGPELYFKMMRAIARTLARCLKD